jgi:hypothetical protein
VIVQHHILLIRFARVLLLGALVCGCGELLLAQRIVNFPPPDAKAPPPMKSPPRTQASGEDTFLFGENGPSMRRSQERRPPPPTTLTVMVKLEYGDKLQYIHPDGTAQTFLQWQSFKDDGFKIMRYTNERLADGNNYTYATQPLASARFDPLDIPLLYMTGDYDFVLSDAEVENLRRYILDGGTILFNAARGRDEFSRAVVKEMRRVFPQKNFLRIPLDHPIYSSRYRVQQVMMMINGVQFMRDPSVLAIDIGTRAAAILVPDGFGAAWSETEYHPAGRHIVGESAVRLGVNLVAYVLGNTEYGRFLAQTFPQYSGQTRHGDVFRFALGRYIGSWNVNPALQNSLLRGLNRNTDIDVDYAPRFIALDDEALLNEPLILLTGHYDFEWSPGEIENLQNYVRRGGLIFASAAAGLSPFDIAFRREIKRLLPDADLIPLPPTHRLFSGAWNPIGEVEYTAAALREDPTLKWPQCYGVIQDGNLVVLYTPFDLFSGLNRESNGYARGVTSEDALRIAIAVITYGMSH